MLNNLDWELEKRNLRFARYADDCLAFVGSQAAGERVMKSLQRFLGESLRLTVNTRKSAVGRPWERSFLGFTFSRRELKIKVSDKALTKLKATVRQLSPRTRGHHDEFEDSDSNEFSISVWSSNVGVDWQLDI